MRIVMKLAMVLALAVGASAGVVASAGTATAQLRSGCHRRDPFGPTVRQMKHFYWCKTGRTIQVVWYVPPTVAAQSDADLTITPESGGPPCTWYAYHIAKVCYTHDIPRFICTKYYADGTVYGYHCGATEAFNRVHAEGLWSALKRVFTSHQAKRCLVGGSPAVAAGVIVRGAPGGPWGIAASAGAGCVAGILSYWWH